MGEGGREGRDETDRACAGSCDAPADLQSVP